MFPCEDRVAHVEVLHNWERMVMLGTYDLDPCPDASCNTQDRLERARAVESMGSVCNGYL